MIEKVVKHIDELDQSHLKLLVMHDFMWALIKEWASNKARTHQISNKDSDHDVRVMDTEGPRHLLQEDWSGTKDDQHKFISIKSIRRYSSTWRCKDKSWSRHQKLQEDWSGTKILATVQ